MLLVKTSIDKSSIAGIGLFADQYIPKGTVIWKLYPKFDISYTKDDIEELSEPALK